ncbi:uncharacterized protein LOC125578148 [Brassica napus]|uniref:uncharacterized protein LOC125578148 n=1 Tax=Brassica napus TaxID=3708 RepID=UPI0020785370|nr:uncharacterized protein LOC125578148 [Brassica napus]
MATPMKQMDKKLQFERASIATDNVLVEEHEDLYTSSGRSTDDARSVRATSQTRRTAYRVAEDRAGDSLGNLKLIIPSFSGTNDPDAYLEWEEEDGTEFNGYALHWWEQIVTTRRRTGEPQVSSWFELKTITNKSVVPGHYSREVDQKLMRLTQETRGVEDYYQEMEILMMKAVVEESHEATMARFLAGLNREVQDRLELQESGGLALYYNNEFEVKISYTSNRMIDVEAVALGRRVYITFVYGDPVQELREQVWERLTRFGLARSEPWFVIGDLNEITGNHEKDGGAIRSPDSFVPFNTMIRNGGLLEFPARGNKLSWQGRRGKGVGAVMVRCRLDRALANEEWHTLFPCSYTEYLRMVASDHRPVVAYLEDKVVRRKGQFKFDKRWIGQDGLLEAITSGWKEQNGSQPEPFVTKISNCRHEIAKWRKDNPPFGKEKINELQKALEEVQMDNNRSQEDILDVSRKLQEAYKDEEDYWFQKSRNMWYSSGDRNTEFYHALTRQRRVRNRIVGLHDVDGNWITDDEGVEKVAVNYFDELFTTTSPTAFDNFLSEIQPSISTQTNGWLLRLATEEEIRQALFMMHPGKAPGPDGMTALFFQHSWHIIKSDLVELVLCQRLKICLPSLISETQSAFVAGRLISDNILIAQEMFHGLRANKACQGKFMAIKTDMSKAYDRLEWDFIQAILLKMGFDTHWVKLMMACISSVQYRVLLNGQPRGLIIPQRGLRQGDPLSPYLFILCTEALIANIKKAERENQLTGMKVARACPSISHLLFADDSLFFCKAQEAECHTILRILQDYAAVSGQLINFQKSSIQFGHKIEDSRRQMMRDILGIQKCWWYGYLLRSPREYGRIKDPNFWICTG